MTQIRHRTHARKAGICPHEDLGIPVSNPETNKCIRKCFHCDVTPQKNFIAQCVHLPST